MAAKTANVTVSSTSWAALSAGEETVLVSMRSGYLVELAVADSGADLNALGAGHKLSHSAISMPFYGCQGNVYARLSVSDLNPVGLVVTAY